MAPRGRNSDVLKLYGDTFPLLVAISPERYDTASIRQMSDAFEPFFARSQRYAVITASPRTAPTPGPAERKLITDWTNSPRVRDATSRLCIGRAVIVPGTLARGALPAMLWIWTPPSPLKPVGTIDEALDHCLSVMKKADLSLPMGEGALRKLVFERLKHVV